MSILLALTPPLAVMLLLTLIPIRTLMLTLTVTLVFLFHESLLHFVHQS